MRTATHGTYIMHKASPCKKYYTTEYIDILYIYVGFDQNSFIRERPFFANKHFTSRNFRELHVYLSRGPCWPTTPLIKIRSPPAKLRQRITDHFLIAFKHAASITESLLRADCCWLGFFGRVYWPTPFNMHFDFRPLFRITFAELSRKYPYLSLFTDPGYSRGCIEGKVNTRGLGVWLSQSLTFGNLATAFGACFLRLQKASLGSDSGRCKDVLQDHGVWLSRSLAFGSSAATYEGCDCPQAPPHRELNQNQTEILYCPSPAGPRAAVGGSPLHNDYSIQLSRNFREKKKSYFRELGTTLSRGFPT